MDEDKKRRAGTSRLSEAENEFADLLERCGLPEITRRELLERFLTQSSASEAAARDLREARTHLEQLRQMRASFTEMIARSLRIAAAEAAEDTQASPRQLHVVQPSEGA